MTRFFVFFFLLINLHLVKGQTSLYQKAEALVALEDYEGANLIFSQLQQKSLAEKDIDKYLSSSLAFAENLSYLEYTDSSISIIKQAIALAKDELMSDSLLAVAYHKLANIQYSSLNEDLRAINNWKRAINIRKTILPSNHLDIIKAYKNIGNAYVNLQKLEEGKKYLQTALDLHLTRSQKDSFLIARTYNELGWALTLLQDYDNAGKYLNVALGIYNALFPEEPWILSEVYENMVYYFSGQGQYVEMINHQKEILEKYGIIEDKLEDDYIAIANIYSNLGFGYDLMDSLKQALKYYTKSLQINQKQVLDNNLALALNYQNLADIYTKKGDFGAAIKALSIAVLLNTKANNKTGLAINLKDKASILLKKGTIELALKSINEAIELISPTNQSLILDKSLLVSFLSEKLTIQKALGKKDASHLHAAIETIQQIINLTQELRTGYQSDASKSFLAKKAKRTFENAIELYLTLYKNTQDKKYLAEAFQITEQAKSIILMDAVQQAEAKNTVEVPAELLEKETALKRQIAQKEKALFLKEAEEHTLNNELIILNRSLEKLTDTLKANYPKYHAAKYATALPKTTTIFQEIEGNLLEYFVGDSMIYAFLLNKEKQTIQVTEIPLDFPLTDWIKQLRVNIYRPFLQKVRSDEATQKMADDLVEVAYQLHQKLIAPVIGQQKLSEKLIIVPDGVLGYIPFEVLISTLPEESTFFGAHDYLLKQYQISYAYAAALLLEMKYKRATEPANVPFTAFAPEFEAENPTAFVQDIEIIRGDLGPLAFNTPEVEALQKLVGGQLFIGKKASKANFMEHAPNSKILHLATHGKANDEAGDYAFLAFTNVEGEAASKLYNRDLYNLDLNAEMVVLSACETGIGELQKGEGIISLARGFSYAGAKSIITTLWSINDVRTKELMEHFYTYLKNGQTKDAALRQAKLDFIDNYSHNAHPFYWAAFIAVGDMQAIELSTPFNWGLIGGLFLVGLGLFFILVKFKKKKPVV